VSLLQLGLAFVSAVEPNSRKDTAFLPPFKARLSQAPLAMAPSTDRAATCKLTGSAPIEVFNTNRQEKRE